MASVPQHPSIIPLLTISRSHHKRRNLLAPTNTLQRGSNFPRINTKRRIVISCTNTPPWEPAPVAYAPNNEVKLLKEPSNIFDAIDSSSTESSQQVESATTNHQQLFAQLQNLNKWPLWILGPALLLATGVVPTLWLPISSIFLGPSIASLLALTGLDCIFNLGATLFLLMADSSARSKDDNVPLCESKPPQSYQFWNVIANVLGFIVPLAIFLCSHRGLIQPHTSFISFAVVLGPYFLLLCVQMLTEMLTWHWRSPVWLVTPVVYEAYRLLQLMRGLKLGDELGSPLWMMHLVRGLVCGWVLVLGVQLMRVAWYAGFTANSYQKQSEATSS